MESPILTKNEEYIVTIEGYTSEGLGVAHLHDRALFVPRAARGDTVRVGLTGVRSHGPVYARILEIIEPSPHRVMPDCPHADLCGGCDFQHIAYEEELYAKRRRVEDALKRLAGLTLPIETFLPAPRREAYRNKALFPVRSIDGRPKTGFFRARSHELVPCDRCLIQHPDADRAAGALRTYMETHGIPAYDELTGRGIVRHLLVRRSEASGEMLAAVVTARPLGNMKALTDALTGACEGMTSVVHILNAGRGNEILRGKARVLHGPGSISERLCGMNFRISARSFFQVNTAQAEALYILAGEMLGPAEHLLDLCCGAGATTLCLGRDVGQVTGLDISPDAIADARENARENGRVDARFVCADMSDVEQVLSGTPCDIIATDPPRRGLTEAAVTAIVGMKPRKVLCISCDPATLARDAKRLTERGYRAARLCAVDMFPRTANVESILLLERDDG